jgi:hypothetical protein
LNHYLIYGSKGDEMKSITIHNLKELLSHALGLDKKKKKYADYSDLCGIWTEAEEAEFHGRIKDMEAVV